MGVSFKYVFGKSDYFKSILSLIKKFSRKDLEVYFPIITMEIKKREEDKKADENIGEGMRLLFK